MPAAIPCKIFADKIGADVSIVAAMVDLYNQNIGGDLSCTPIHFNEREIMAKKSCIQPSWSSSNDFLYN